MTHKSIATNLLSHFEIPLNFPYDFIKFRVKALYIYKFNWPSIPTRALKG